MQISLEMPHIRIYICRLHTKSIFNLIKDSISVCGHTGLLWFPSGRLWNKSSPYLIIAD